MTDLTPSPLLTGLWWLLLVLLLTLSGVLGALASLLALIVALVLGVLIGPKAWLSVAREPFALCFTGGFALMTTTTLINANDPIDAIHVFDFAPMLLALPVFVVARAFANQESRLAIATLSLVGVTLALVSGVLEVVVWGSSRPYGFLNNAIIYGHTTAVIGFLALTGYFLSVHPIRYLYLLGPILGAMVLVLSGTRGGMLALPGAFLIAFAVILYSSQHRLRVLVSSVLVLALLLPSAYFVQSQTHGRAENLFDVIPALVWGNGEVDSSTSVRLRMYETGVRAFLDSPIVGHGWANQMQAASAYMTEAEMPEMVRTHFHLHSDIVNFAVSSGIVGIVSLILFLAAPLVQAAVRRRDYESHYVILSYYGSMAAMYAVSGLFFMTLGFDISTTIFALTTALVAGLYQKTNTPE